MSIYDSVENIGHKEEGSCVRNLLRRRTVMPATFLGGPRRGFPRIRFASVRVVQRSRRARVSMDGWDVCDRPIVELPPLAHGGQHPLSRSNPYRSGAVAGEQRSNMYKKQHHMIESVELQCLCALAVRTSGL